MSRYCEICEEEVNSFFFHIKKKHNISAEEYKNKYLPKKYCLNCENQINNPKSSSLYCCEKCRKEYYNKQEILESRKDPEGKTECRICGFMSPCVGIHVVQKHKISLDDYKKEYNLETKDCYSEKYLNNLSENIKGDKNPFYQHGGKYSPFSKKFIHYSDESSDEKIKEIFNKVKQTKKDHPENISTRIEYWLAKGYDIETAKEKLYDRQNTFSLDACIKKLGIEQGTLKFNQRQEKWQNTLNSKSEEEKARINKLKISKGFSISKAEKYIFDQLKNDFDIEQQFTLFDENRSYIYDIVDIKKKKIIEYNGDFWHANPNIYSENFVNKRNKKTAKNIWEQDSIKLNIAKSHGYEVMVIWEQEYNLNKKEIINKCKEFLNE